MNQFKMGRIRPKSLPALSLNKYLLNITPPMSVDYSPSAAESLSRMYKNDSLGDCVIAGGGHFRGITSSNAGLEVQFTDNQIVNMYSAACGYQPGNPNSDQGCDEQVVMNYWQQVGFPDGVKLAGWVAVDATNQQECETALYLFENLFFGLELPDAWVSPAPDGSDFIWDVAGSPDPQNGHCVTGVGYNPAGVKISTWGMTGLMTWAAVQAYCVSQVGGALYVMISPDMINSAIQKSPNGLNWVELVTDFNQITPNPIPVPPTPVPVPPTPPPVPIPPIPVPPIPVPPSPIPIPDIKAEIDAIFAKMENNFAGRPIVEAVLRMTNALVDEYFASLG